jgi:hypothetical protein
LVDYDRQEGETAILDSGHQVYHGVTRIADLNPFARFEHLFDAFLGGVAESLHYKDDLGYFSVLNS